MLFALIEGLAGIVDRNTLFRGVRLSPRWIAAGCDDVSVSAAYAASGAGIGYDYSHVPSNKNISMEIRGNAAIDFHLLLPPGTKATSIAVDGRTVPFRQSAVEQSRYADASFSVKKKTSLTVRYAG